MKKTYTINISGSIFHIEENAFEKLQDYLKMLSKSFGSQEGGQEILQDIESRIAELLQEKIGAGQEAVTDESVEDVMQRMGKPEDFMDQEEAAKTGKSRDEKTKKRLYRDGENRVLGGVCSGMSAYFNLDPVFLRILFVVLVFIGVGVSVVVYLILWIVVPEAKTTAQRLEMRGEEATISNIQKTIQDELKEVKEGFSKINQSEMAQKGKDLVNKTGQATVQIFKGLGKVVGIVFGSLLILTGFIGFVVFLITMAIGGSVFQSHAAGLNPEVDFSGLLGFMVSPGLFGFSILLLVLLIGIPLLAILFVGTKLVFRYKTNNKLIGLGAFGIWLFALVSLIALSAGQVSNFSQKNTVSSGKPLNCPTCKTMSLEIGTTPENMDSGKNVLFEDFTTINLAGEKVLTGIPRLRIEATDAPDFSIIIKRIARGKNTGDVQNNLENIQYNVTSKDSTLILEPYFILTNQSKWRRQEVEVTVKVPTGKSVHLGANLNRLQFDFENTNNIWNQEMTGKTWLMTPEGLSLKE
jgi:phage shock protein PspC (stress-responsive transcriptional regulator)/predicted Zn-ribbon and HTH transcriptional regulator